MAAFSAAVRACSKLYCWNTKPRWVRRKRMRSGGGIAARSRPKRLTEPEWVSSSPAMTEMSVVFPQPLGPTRKLSSPFWTV